MRASRIPDRWRALSWLIGGVLIAAPDGEIIGAVGTTGYSTGCHLHYSTWVNGQLADPISLF